MIAVGLYITFKNNIKRCFNFWCLFGAFVWGVGVFVGGGNAAKYYVLFAFTLEFRTVPTPPEGRLFGL